MIWKEKYKDRLLSSAQAAATIKDGDRLFSPMGGSIPYQFYEALADRALELKGLLITFGCVSKPLRICEKQYNGSAKKQCFFMGKLERDYIKSGSDLTYIPVHFSDMTGFVLENHYAKVIAISGSAPDENGMISTGASHMDAALLEDADRVIVQVNRYQPYIQGEGTMIPVDRVDVLIEGDDEILESSRAPDDMDWKIGGYVAERISDGACIQLGVGASSVTVGKLLQNKKDLGIHSEFLCDSMVELIDCGAVTNSRKKLRKGITTFGFCSMSKYTLNFLDNNPMAEKKPYIWLNNPQIIAQNDNVVSVNSAIQIDLSGQICAESIGLTEFSGTGGQADFVRGAKWSKGGKSFIVMKSIRTDKNGLPHSKISLSLPLGSSVTTPKSDVHYIVTEYGVADLRGKTLADRARMLIAIAHPDFRDSLSFEAREAGIIL